MNESHGREIIGGHLVVIGGAEDKYNERRILKKFLSLAGDEKAIRIAALQFDEPCVTTINGAEALVEAIGAKVAENSVIVRSLQEIHAGTKSVKTS